jgi:ribose 1,5-bisphosphate isomerase
MCKEIVEKVRNDHTSGASELSRLAAECFITFSSKKESKKESKLFEEALKLGRSLISAQPYMAPIFNLVNSILYAIEEKKDTFSDNQIRELVKSKAQDFIQNSLASLEKIGQYGETLVEEGSTVLTHSSSGSILAILKKAKVEGRNFKVIATESRPMLEGKILARFLGEEGIPTTLIVDAAVGAVIKQVDLILVGADSISETSFVNKVGTKYLALLAQENNMPLYVACERSKFISKVWRIKPKSDGDPEEVLTEKFKNVKAMNPYYEEVPLSFCRGIMTNEGMFMHSDVSNFIRQTRMSKKLTEELKSLRK